MTERVETVSYIDAVNRLDAGDYDDKPVYAFCSDQRGAVRTAAFVSGHSRLNDECDFQQYLSLLLPLFSVR